MPTEFNWSEYSRPTRCRSRNSRWSSIARIELWRADHGQDLSGNSHIKSRGGAALELLLRVFDVHFARGLEVVDLQTGELLDQDMTDEDDTRSYSVPFKAWCTEHPERY